VLDERLVVALLRVVFDLVFVFHLVFVNVVFDFVVNPCVAAAKTRQVIVIGERVAAVFVDAEYTARETLLERPTGAALRLRLPKGPTAGAARGLIGTEIAKRFAACGSPESADRRARRGHRTSRRRRRRPRLTRTGFADSQRPPLERLFVELLNRTLCDGTVVIVHEGEATRSSGVPVRWNHNLGGRTDGGEMVPDFSFAGAVREVAYKKTN
jgi:hypothetical protein